MTQRKGLRAALKDRRTRTTWYDMPLEEYSVCAERQRALTIATQAQAAAEALLIREGPENAEIRAAHAKAKDAVAAARKELNACFHRIEFRGLPEEEFDALVQLHPPTNDQLEAAEAKGEELPMFNEETIYPALLELCAQDSELSADEWRQELKGWTRGELRDIRSKVLEANIRSYATALTFV